MEKFKTEEVSDENYRCLTELKDYRGYMPVGIEVDKLERKLANQCKGCALKKELGFCAIKDELIEIKDRAVDVQKHTVFRSPAPSFSDLREFSTNPTSDMTNPMGIGRKYINPTEYNDYGKV